MAGGPVQVPRLVLRFPGTLAGFAEANDALHRLLDDRQVSGPARFNLELVFEELAVNIVRYGSPSADIEAEILFGEHEVVLTIEDDGIPFDPSRVSEPAVPASLDDAVVGGLGVMLVKKVSTRLIYERTPEHRNRLTLAIAAR